MGQSRLVHSTSSCRLPCNTTIEKQDHDPPSFKTESIQRGLDVYKRWSKSKNRAPEKPESTSGSASCQKSWNLDYGVPEKPDLYLDYTKKL
jgi:hypothetical protein